METRPCSKGSGWQRRCLFTRWRSFVPSTGDMRTHPHVAGNQTIDRMRSPVTPTLQSLHLKTSSTSSATPSTVPLFYKTTSAATPVLDRFRVLLDRFWHEKTAKTSPENCRHAPGRALRRFWNEVFAFFRWLKTPPVFCRKALPRLRRGRFRSATGPPLQCNKGSVATPGGPYGKTFSAPLGNRGDGVILNRLSMRRLENM